MDAEEFYQMVKQPGFDNDMQFEVKVTNPENTGTFSHEGVVNIVNNMHDFILARIFGQWEATGKPPRHMLINLDIKWDTDLNIATAGPYYEGRELSQEGLQLIDGKHRIPWRGED